MQLQKLTRSVLALTVAASILAGIVCALALAIVKPVTVHYSIGAVAGSFLVYIPLCLFGALIFGAPIFLVLVFSESVKWWIWVPCVLVISPLVEVMANGVANFEVRNLSIFIPLSFVAAGVFRIALEVWKRYSERDLKVRSQI